MSNNKSAVDKFAREYFCKVSEIVVANRDLSERKQAGLTSSQSSKSLFEIDTHNIKDVRAIYKHWISVGAETSENVNMALDVSHGGAGSLVLLERWKLCYIQLASNSNEFVHVHSPGSQRNGLVDTHERVKYQLRTLCTLSKILPAFKLMKKLNAQERTAPTFRISPIADEDVQMDPEQPFDCPSAVYDFPVIQDEEYMFQLKLSVQYRVDDEAEPMGASPAKADNAFIAQNQRQARRSQTIHEQPSSMPTDLPPRDAYQRRHSSPIPIHKKKIDIAQNLKSDYFPSFERQSDPDHTSAQRQTEAHSAPQNAAFRDSRRQQLMTHQSDPEPLALGGQQQPRGRSMRNFDEQNTRQRQRSLDNTDTGMIFTVGHNSLAYRVTFHPP